MHSAVSSCVPILGMGLVMIPFVLISILSTILWIWMLIECATKESSEGNDKIVWIIVIVLAGSLGALIYLLVRRPRRIVEHGQ